MSVFPKREKHINKIIIPTIEKSGLLKQRVGEDAGGLFVSPITPYRSLSSQPEAETEQAKTRR